MFGQWTAVSSRFNLSNQYTTDPDHPLFTVCGWILEASEVTNPSSQKKTPVILSHPYGTMWGGLSDSPELIDMPQRGCSLITYRSNRSDMQSICQRASQARWDKCPPNSFHRAARWLREESEPMIASNPTCQLFHIRPCHNVPSLADIYSTSSGRTHVELLINHKNSRTGSRFWVWTPPLIGENARLQKSN